MELATLITTVVAASVGVVFAVYQILRDKFNKIDDKFNRVDDKLDKILDELKTLNNAVTRIDTQQQEHEKKLDAMSTHGERIATLEAQQSRVNNASQKNIDTTPTSQPVTEQTAATG
ncbi:MAG: hypothetical protein OXI96_08210 [Acidimicrobiaceae bacterium]|nr:hypothetical protein [Acidimicrobiaceae bacterium]